MQQSGDYRGPAQLEILLVEDNPGDVALFKQALRNSGIAYCLTVANDGLQALEILKGKNGGPAAYRPHVVFLDLNLPAKRGAEVLADMKSDAALAAVPVAILTGSDHPDDRSTCASLGANAYFSKAVALEEFAALAAQIQSFLIAITTCSPGDPSAICPATSAA